MYDINNFFHIFVSNLILSHSSCIRSNKKSRFLCVFIKIAYASNWFHFKHYYQEYWRFEIWWVHTFHNSSTRRSVNKMKHKTYKTIGTVPKYWIGTDMVYGPLCCLFFFDIKILITAMVSSNSSRYIYYLHLQFLNNVIIN